MVLANIVLDMFNNSAFLYIILVNTYASSPVPLKSIGAQKTMQPPFL